MVLSRYRARDPASMEQGGVDEEVKYVLIGIIFLYQRLISPFLGDHCRFYPTCSEYFRQALIKWGFWKGSWMGMVRICKCHPFHSGGYDPVTNNKYSLK